ncbi:carotenoid cleavage dioxygenase 1 [Coniochaeta ligniaria NRRL 30616]|uniref:Carotenoid cleavage dioxygenase 1 n=1 Tax=Coniochaeta ligniaria NRRL 30616 TaxID=1408157 RepID=A0A1J7J7J0_9PEZI|nr:carotenoid cleavage dioxygenase 1 [Coniochaeta ligniaria NRRL 30616]
MPASNFEGPGEPIHRTAADEAQDYEKIVQNMIDGVWVDWPNEAGFLGLEEERGPVDIKVQGSIPEWVEGSLFRTGPGVYDIEDTPKGTWRTSHWFDGLAQTHRFDIRQSDDKSMKVYYSSRRQSQHIVDRIRKQGTRAGYSFGQKADPCLGLYSKFMAAWSAMSPETSKRGDENVAVAVQINPPFKPDMKLSGHSPGESATPNAPVTNGHRSGVPKDVWLTTDTAGMKQIDPTTLEPIGFVRQDSLHPDLKGQMSCAHPHRDPENGDFYNYNLEMARHSTYRIFRVSAATGQTEILATIQRPGVKPAYIHSFFLSQNFVILSIPSSHLAWNGLATAWHRNVMEGLEAFSPDKKTQWFVIDRRHGKGVVAEFQTDAGFFFHTVNAFEERDEQDRSAGTVSLSMDVVQYLNTDMLYGLYVDVVLDRDGGHARYWDSSAKVATSNTHLNRYRVRAPLPENDTVQANPSVTKGRAIPVLAPERTVSILGPHSGELPTINPAYATRRSRYVYGLAARGFSTLADSLVKTDVDTGDVVFWNGPHGHTPSEAIFVARPGATAEDDGVLLVVVLDGHARGSYLLCLDARTMGELGRAHVPVAIGIGFHGAHSKM